MIYDEIIYGHMHDLIQLTELRVVLSFSSFVHRHHHHRPYTNNIKTFKHSNNPNENEKRMLGNLFKSKLKFSTVKIALV
jgi:hypothetical protein